MSDWSIAPQTPPEIKGARVVRPLDNKERDEAMHVTRLQEQIIATIREAGHPMTVPQLLAKHPEVKSNRMHTTLHTMSLSTPQLLAKLGTWGSFSYCPPDMLRKAPERGAPVESVQKAESVNQTSVQNGDSVNQEAQIAAAAKPPVTEHPAAAPDKRKGVDIDAVHRKRATAPVKVVDTRPQSETAGAEQPRSHTLHLPIPGKSGAFVSLPTDFDEHDLDMLNAMLCAYLQRARKGGAVLA